MYNNTQSSIAISQDDLMKLLTDYNNNKRKKGKKSNRKPTIVYSTNNFISCIFHWATYKAKYKNQIEWKNDAKISICYSFSVEFIIRYTKTKQQQHANTHREKKSKKNVHKI